MLDKRFDPQKFIDREFEQELFEELLQLKDQARILAIRDEGGMGKSQLLQKFQYRCRTAGRPRIPVGLVDLKQLPDPSPLGLVQQIEKELTAFLKFPTFTQLETARRAYDFTTIRGAVDLRSANLHQAEMRVAGVMTNVAQAELITVNTATITAFTPDQQATARDLCVQAFLDDLMAHCRQQLVVILLDSFEYCQGDLQAWLLDYFLEPHCFDLARRPANLLVVLAGRELPNFEQHWSLDECAQLVKSVRALGKWQATHVEECLRVHGFRYTERQLKLFCEMVEMGSPPSLVVETMRSILPMRDK
ncbi:MAG: hypothetical protein U0350_41535 [Caldilineaceae bacterium]